MAAQKKNGALPVGSLEQLQEAADSGVDIETLSVPEWGMSVKVRGLYRGEARQLADMDAAETEAFVLSCALVEPAVTVEQAETLLEKKSFASTERVLQKVLDLSGLGATFRQG